MSVIRTHDVTLADAEHGIALRPMTDGHLPLLYRWNSDPEVLYWSDSDDVQSYPPEVVRQIYGGVSQNSFCFIIEADGVPIGECWLQPMNLPPVRAMYPEGTDVRRIDMCIGEKEYWGRGIGTRLIVMLTGFAFEQQGVDVLHCFSDDYNVRSRRVWEKNGFTLAHAEDLPQPAKGRQELHWRLTRAEYESRRR